MSETLHPSTVPMYARAGVFGVMFTIVPLFLTRIIPYDPTLLILATWVVAILVSLVTWISHQFISIEVSDNEIIYKSGVLNTKIMIIPYNQITNLNIRRTLFSRILGLGTLDIDTASGTQRADIEIENLPYNGLEKLLERSKGKFTIRKQ